MREQGLSVGIEKRVEVMLLRFYALSAVGWLWEVLFTYVRTGLVVNRGFLHGPWMPVYGMGGALMLLFPVRYGIGALFMLSAMAGAAVEYGVAALLEGAYRCRWWDYAGWPGAVDGRICVLSTAVFGLAGVILIRRLGPWLREKLEGIGDEARGACCRILSICFALDIILSLFNPNKGPWVTFPL